MTGSTSALESCSRKIRYFSIIMVAAAFAATAFIVCPASASEVEVYGMESWLAEIASRSLTAVVQKLPAERQAEETERVVRIVSERLFDGYSVSTVDADGASVRVVLEPTEPPPQWQLRLQPPSLAGPAVGWFEADFDKVSGDISSLLRGLPVRALTWCDEGLRDAITEVLKPSLSGWRPGLSVQMDGEQAVLQVSFAPELPLIVAITPTFFSTSLSTLFYDELKNDVIERGSVFTGLPVAWAAQHREDINRYVEVFLADKNLMTTTHSRAVVELSPAPVSRASISVESSRYTLWGWSAVYAGTSDRSAELGVHIGRKAVLFPRSEVELYAEAIMELQEWSAEGRFGMRFMPWWKGVWLGGEYSTDDKMWWARISIEPQLHKPYAWLRAREGGEINATLGWKATEFISFELHYDSRNDDSLSLRILGNL